VARPKSEVHRAEDRVAVGKRAKPRLQDSAAGAAVLGLGTWDLGLGTWDLGLGTWDLAQVGNE